MSRALLKDGRMWAALLATGVVASYLSWGAPAGVGLSLGLVGGAFSFWALARVSALMGSAAREQPAPRLGATLTVAAFLLKLPVLAALGYVCFRLGTTCSACFLAGLALVYCALLGWVVARG